MADAPNSTNRINLSLKQKPGVLEKQVDVSLLNEKLQELHLGLSLLESRADQAKKSWETFSAQLSLRTSKIKSLKQFKGLNYAERLEKFNNWPTDIQKKFNDRYPLVTTSDVGNARENYFKEFIKLCDIKKQIRALETIIETHQAQSLLKSLLTGSSEEVIDENQQYSIKLKK